MKSAFATAVDEIQAALRPALRERGFRCRGRTFNRPSEDGLTHVVWIYMGRSDPPGTTEIPGMRENLHGLFTIELGVYVPETARAWGIEAKAWVDAGRCAVRTRLGALIGDGKDLWWPARSSEAVIADVRRALLELGMPFLDRFATRERILAEWSERSRKFFGSPRIVWATILAERGERSRARELLAFQMRERKTVNPRHAAWVRDLAVRLGLEPLDEE